MDGVEGKSKSHSSVVGTHANKLPAEIVGRFLQKLSVGDRLKSERVSPRWKRALERWGWTEQRKLNREIVFEGASEGEIARFWEHLDEGNCYLISMLHRRQIALHLVELDLDSFAGGENLVPFVPKIAESLESLPKLEKINIKGFDLSKFVEHLPPTLNDLKTSGRISVRTLNALADRCPNLEEVPFGYVESDSNFDNAFELIGKFPRLKKLELSSSVWHFASERRPAAALASIGQQLRELEHLDVFQCEHLKREAFEAIVSEATGCQRLRSFRFDARHLSEQTLLLLAAKMPALTSLQIYDGGQCGAFSDAVLKAIARREKLKQLNVCANALTDTAIVELVDRCKSLVSLYFFNCPRIRERSLKAVIAEVRRRHGSPPRTLPSGRFDPGIFYLRATFGTGINNDRARALVGGNNPWLRIEDDPRDL